MILSGTVAAGVGPNSQSPGVVASLRQGQLGDLIISELHGRYYETAYRRNLFYGANQAAQTTTAAFATTYTGLCLSNTPGNAYNLVLNKVGITLASAPAATSVIGLMGNFSATAVNHTTSLTPGSTFIGGASPTGKADSASVLPLAPVLIVPLMGGFTAGSLPSGNPILLDLEGSVIVPPGAYVSIYTSTAVSGLFSFFWEEVPI
jgi:hypothetical protein